MSFDKFAKLFETEECGQVLVVLQSNNENFAPEIRVHTSPKGLGVCALAFGYPDSDEGWNKAEKAFSEFTEEQALRAARMVHQTAPGATA